jgi:indole-3-glycerol phosphate synthase
VIAELKRRSPSKGALHLTLQAVERASGYAAGGAAALSILTEPSEFGGALEDLQEVRSAVPIPLLRKDFIVSPQQIIEARAAGASAVLLIARSLGPAPLAALAAVARDWGLDTLIEIRDEDELDWALDAGAEVIGVNTRNLETLAVDPAVAERLVPLVPPTVPAVFESGVRDREDVALAARVGADAVLVGSSLSVQPDPVAAVAALVGVPRTGRGGGA